MPTTPPLIPDHWLPQPARVLDAATTAAFDRLYASAIQPGAGQLLDDDLPAPKWQLLTYLVETYPVVLHGSGQPDITLFEPRQTNDIMPFGNQKAVFASSDGIWPMFYAILDRDRYELSMLNGCVRIQEPGGEPSVPQYFFSISRPARVQEPWRTGRVYILPGDTFIHQDPLKAGDLTLHVAQAASLVPVAPLASLSISPSDFPFLAQIRGHDDATIAARSQADPNGFPWLQPGD